MTRVKDLMEFLGSIAPFDLQEDYDNAGLIIGNEEEEVNGVLVSLDATPDIIAEAIDRDCNVVVAHHPIIFRGLKRLNGKNYVERAVMMAIRHDIALIAIHTNLDNVLEHGVNQKIAAKLGVIDLEPLKLKKTDHTDYETGSGVIGYLEEKVGAMDFLQRIKKNMKAKCIRYTDLIHPEIHRVAICGGSGGFLLPEAIRKGADIMVTADMKYHEFFDADAKIIVADIGHYESEQFTIELLYELLTKNFTTFAAHYTNQITNPVKYL